MQEDALVDVYWDQNSQEVLLSINQLAHLDGNNDYQLWTLGDEGSAGLGLVNLGEGEFTANGFGLRRLGLLYHHRSQRRK